MRVLPCYPPMQQLANEQARDAGHGLGHAQLLLHDVAADGHLVAVLVVSEGGGADDHLVREDADGPVVHALAMTWRTGPSGR